VLKSVDARHKVTAILSGSRSGSSPSTTVRLPSVTAASLTLFSSTIGVAEVSAGEVAILGEHGADGGGVSGLGAIFSWSAS